MTNLVFPVNAKYHYHITPSTPKFYSQKRHDLGHIGINLVLVLTIFPLPLNKIYQHGQDRVTIQHNNQNCDNISQEHLVQRLLERVQCVDAQ